MIFFLHPDEKSGQALKKGKQAICNPKQRKQKSGLSSCSALFHSSLPVARASLRSRSSFHTPLCVVRCYFLYFFSSLVAPLCYALDKVKKTNRSTLFGGCSTASHQPQ
jgi:hypothetical protein